MVLIIAVLLVVAIFLPGKTLGQIQPYQATYEALKAADDSGANITRLIVQYNSLLSQNGSDASFQTLTQLARNAQQTAIAARSLNDTLMPILVVTVALALTIVTEGLLQLQRRIARRKLLDMEIRRI